MFYVEDIGWLPASMLQEGDILSLEDGRNVPIQRIETNTYNHYVNVYNFEVDDFHTYYVSDFSVLTHNKTPCQTIEAMKKQENKIKNVSKEKLLNKVSNKKLINTINECLEIKLKLETVVWQQLHVLK